MKMGYFWRKQYDPYIENAVYSPPWKDGAVKKMTPCGDCSQFHILVGRICSGNAWPYGYHGILLESNKKLHPWKYHQGSGHAKIGQLVPESYEGKKILFILPLNLITLFPSKRAIGLLFFSSYPAK